MINGYGCYLIYIGIKLHFQNDKYNYFNYNGKSRADHKSYDKRPDKLFFERLANKLQRKQDIEEFFVANFVYGNSNLWIGDSFTEETHSNYLQWLHIIGSISYLFESDLSNIIKMLNDNKHQYADLYIVPKGQHPLLVKMLLQKKIMIETFILFDLILDISPLFNEQIEESVIWPDLLRKCNKYRPFLLSKLDDMKKYKEIFKNHFDSV